MFEMRLFNSPLPVGPVCSLQVYPERDRNELNTETFALRWRASRFPALMKKKLNAAELLDKVNENAESFTKLPKSALIKQILALRKPLRAQGTTIELTASAFSLIRELSGHCLGLRHHDSQILAAWALLNGVVAEMEPGEGKTLAIGLAAATAALAGSPVHVLTINDFLAERDTNNLLPLYQSMGISVGLVTALVGAQERRAAYACDITYCAARELAFDYLRDRRLFGSESSDIMRHIDRLYGSRSRSRRLLLRGLHMAIVDECDNILIDEANTPHFLSGSSTERSAGLISAVNALKIAGTLTPTKHFLIRSRACNIKLTASGVAEIEAQTAKIQPAQTAKNGIINKVLPALCALHLLHKDQHYRVCDNRVQFIDQNTGRVCLNHAWHRELQLMIEVKEGCQLPDEQTVISRMSYQRLLRRYLRCSGTISSASQLTGELRSVYNLNVLTIPTHEPLRRRLFKEKIFATESEKLDAVVKRVHQIHKTGRPVLLATRTLAASEAYSQRFTQEGLVHQMLSALQDSQEAELISKAGGIGSITIATSMAGRGTDIAINNEVIAKGGLYVIVSEHHAARRIDELLFARCARRGNPGSCEIFTSIDDPIYKTCYPPWLIRFIQFCIKQKIPMSAVIVPLISQYMQWRMASCQKQNRRELFKSEITREQAMGFAGPPD